MPRKRTTFRTPGSQTATDPPESFRSAAQRTPQMSDPSHSPGAAPIDLKAPNHLQAWPLSETESPSAKRADSGSRSRATQALCQAIPQLKDIAGPPPKDVIS